MQYLLEVKPKSSLNQKSFNVHLNKKKLNNSNKNNEKNKNLHKNVENNDVHINLYLI